VTVTETAQPVKLTVVPPLLQDTVLLKDHAVVGVLDAATEHAVLGWRLPRGA